jgi:proline iminopeptidase
LAQWGDDVHALCEALGIEKPIVFGQSFGGMVAQSYVTRHPEHARAVVLSSTAARMDLEASLDLFERKGGMLAREIAERFWSSGNDDEFAAYMRVCMPLYNTRERPGGAEARARAIMRPEVYRHFSLPGREIRSMDFRAALKRVVCPVLLLAGAEDPITPPHLAREMLTCLNAGLGTLQIYDGCGHGPFRDQPETVFPALRRFIRGLMS